MARIGIDGLQKRRLGRVGHVNKVQAATIRRDGGDLQVRIDRHIRGVAGQLQLAKHDGQTELRGVDDRQAVRTSGDVGGLIGGLNDGADRGQRLRRPLERHVGQYPCRDRAVAERIESLLQFGQVADAVAGGAEFVWVGADGEFGVIRQPVVVRIRSS